MRLLVGIPARRSPRGHGLLERAVGGAAGAEGGQAESPGEEGDAGRDDQDRNEDEDGEACPEEAEEEGDGGGKEEDGESKGQEEHERHDGEDGLGNDEALCGGVSSWQTKGVEKLRLGAVCRGRTKSSGRAVAKSLVRDQAFCLDSGGTMRSTWRWAKSATSAAVARRAMI
jgi:hypothetical protein